MFQMATQVGHVTVDMVWANIVGYTDHLLHYKISAAAYAAQVPALERHVTEYSSTSSSSSGGGGGGGSGVRVQRTVPTDSPSMHTHS